MAFVFSSGCLDSIPSLSANTGSQSHMAENNGKLSVYFLDVGQGDSSLIVFGNTTILIDAGESDMGERVVRDLHSAGVNHIDLLVATHPHSDHIGGMQDVMDAFPIGQVLDSDMPHPSPLYEKVLTKITTEHIPYTVAERGQTIDLDPGLRILVLSPPENRIGDDLNTNSIVLRISYGTIDMLFTGDAGGEAETAMESSGYPLDAEILKVGHHGSMYSSSKAFIARVNPEIAVISDGKDNPYGHPHKQTLATLNAAGVTLYRTDLDGSIFIRSNGASYSVVTGNANVFSQHTLTTPSSASVTATGVTIPVPVISQVPENISGVLTGVTIPGVLENFTVPVQEPDLPQLGNTSFVQITAVQFDAPGDDRTNLNGEWVRITNSGNGAVLMNGWTLSDKTKSHPYIFPAFVLLPSSSVTVYTGSGSMNDSSLFMGQASPLWGNSGDTATLLDNKGNIIDTRSEGGI